MSKALDDARIDRAAGALLGLAVGDAVGTTVEFKRRGSFPPVADMVGGGSFGLKPGEWTDDSSMALCLAASLIATKGELGPGGPDAPLLSLVAAGRELGDRGLLRHRPRDAGRAAALRGNRRAAGRLRRRALGRQRQHHAPGAGGGCGAGRRRPRRKGPPGCNRGRPMARPSASTLRNGWPAFFFARSEARARPRCGRWRHRLPSRNRC